MAGHPARQTSFPGSGVTDVVPAIWHDERRTSLRRD
jgi:hypothetical protein